MKTINRIWAWVGVLMVAGGLSTAQAKKDDVGFAAFEGTYKAQATTVIYSGMSFPVTAGMKVTVPKSGESATVTVSGTFAAGGMVYPLTNTFVLKKKTIAVADLLFTVPSASASATGTLTLNKAGNRISYVVGTPLEPSLVITGSIAVTKQGKKKKKLSLLLQFTSGSTPYIFPIVGIAKVKPEKD